MLEPKFSKFHCILSVTQYNFLIISMEGMQGDYVSSMSQFNILNIRVSGNWVLTQSVSSVTQSHTGYEHSETVGKIKCLHYCCVTCVRLVNQRVWTIACYLITFSILTLATLKWNNSLITTLSTLHMVDGEKIKGSLVWMWELKTECVKYYGHNILI